MLYEAGVDAIAGLWDGLRSQFDSIVTGVADFATGIGDRVRSVWQSRSPSQVFHEIGEEAMLGLQNGLNSRTVSAVYVPSALGLRSSVGFG